MTRDSLLLKIGQIAAIVGGILAAASDPSDYGLSEVAMRWVLLACTIIGTLSGHLGTSPLKGENDATKRSAGAPMWLLPILLAGAVTLSACGLRIGAPATPAAPGEVVSVTPEEINRAAIVVANAGTEILGIVDQALTLAHEVIPPSQLRLDINQAVGDFARAAKSSAQTAKAVLTAESLTALARELAVGVDKVLAALERSTHEGLAKFASQIRTLAAPIRAAMTGGVQ